MLPLMVLKEKRLGWIEVFKSLHTDRRQEALHTLPWVGLKEQSLGWIELLKSLHTDRRQEALDMLPWVVLKEKRLDWIELLKSFSFESQTRGFAHASVGGVERKKSCLIEFLFY